MTGGTPKAAFFIRRELRPATDDELWSALGVDRVRRAFGPLAIAERRTELLRDHVCAQIEFAEASWAGLMGARPRDGRELSLDQDPALPLAIAFRDGAARAAAEVAFLIAPGSRRTLDSVFERYWMVQTRDTNALAAERFALLYVDDGTAASWTPPARLLWGRDELTGGPGRTLFSQRGWSRWS